MGETVEDYLAIVDLYRTQRDEARAVASLLAERGILREADMNRCPWCGRVSITRIVGQPIPPLRHKTNCPVELVKAWEHDR